MNGEHYMGDDPQMDEIIDCKSIELEWIQVYSIGPAKPDDKILEVKVMNYDQILKVRVTIYDEILEVKVRVTIYDEILEVKVRVMIYDEVLEMNCR